MPRIATRKPQVAPETYLSFRFPLAGVSQTFGFEAQPNAVVGQDVARTSPFGLNVRSFDPSTDRARGGARPGLQKFIQGQVSGTNPLQEICSVVVTDGVIPGTGQTVTEFMALLVESPDGSGGFTPPRQATYNTSSGLTLPFLIPEITQTSIPAGSISFAAKTVTARAFVSGGANQSFTTEGIADDTAVTVSLAVASIFNAGTAVWLRYYMMVVNGVHLFSSTDYLQTLPGTNLDVFTCGVVSGDYHYVAGIQADGNLMRCAIDDAGAVFWSATGSAATGITPSDLTGDETSAPNHYNDDLYFSHLSLAISGTSLCVNLPGIAGAAKMSLADGTSFTIMKTAAEIFTSTTYDSASAISRNGQNSCAAAGDVLAVTLADTITGNCGLVFIKPTTGGFLYTALTGLNTSPATTPDQGYAIAEVVSDGTNFYVCTTLGAPGPGMNYTNLSVVKKVSGSTGLVMWTTEVASLFAGRLRICYLSGLAVLEVHGQNYSVQLHATTGAVVGAGVISSGTRVFGMADDGSVTVGATTISTNSTTGPVDVLIAISDGDFKVASDGVWTTPTNGTNAFADFSDAPVIRAFQAFGYVYPLDGINYKRYSSTQNLIESWTATYGTLPTDSGGNKARIGCLWQGRAVLAALPKDPRNWFMSAISDPLDWDYSPAAQTAAQAVAGNSSRRFGIVGDSVTGLIPYSDDVLLFLCANSIYALRGNPMDGGRIDLLTNAIGGAFGNAWCMDPFGQIYFMSNRQGVYRMTRDSLPMRISQNIDRRLRDIDLANSVVRLQWDDQFQGVHVYTTSTTQSQPATHHFFDSRMGAWWPEEFPDDLNPRCCHTFQGNNNAQQVAVIGSEDGYVRTFSAVAGSDDGTAIASEVWIGPFVTKNFDDILMKDLQALMGVQSGPVTWAVYKGATAEDAFGSSDSVASGTWTNDNGGRNMLSQVRASEHAFYVKLTSTNSWSMESIRAKVSIGSKISRRGA